MAHVTHSSQVQYFSFSRDVYVSSCCSGLRSLWGQNNYININQMTENLVNEWLVMTAQVQSIYLYTYNSLIILINWLIGWLLEAVRTNPGYGMATLIYNNLLNLILEVSRIIVPPVTQLLRSKWLNLFFRCTKRKIESFWPKNLGQIFFCQ